MPRYKRKKSLLTKLKENVAKSDARITSAVKANSIQVEHGRSYVYILNMQVYDSEGNCIYKIGHSKNPKRRAWEGYDQNTFCIMPPLVEKALACPYKYREKIEKKAHRLLNEYRYNKHREFFVAPLALCEQAIDEAHAYYMLKQPKKGVIKTRE